MFPISQKRPIKQDIHGTSERVTQGAQLVLGTTAALLSTLCGVINKTANPASLRALAEAQQSLAPVTAAAQEVLHGKSAVQVTEANPTIPRPGF